jgi:1,4-dihydroxy-2-naphthoate octaprenyltransferase
MKIKIKAWFFLFRPWSYTATIIPFFVAAAIVPAGWSYWRFAAGIIAGIFFQATVNLLNTWGDERSGVDSAPGAIRTTPQVHEGLISMKALFAVALLCSFCASAIGTFLCFHLSGDTWCFSIPLLISGIIGLLGSLNYSTGIKFKYHGLGVPFVAFLMGPLEIFTALCIIAPEQALSFLTVKNLLLSLPIAALVCVIMHGNDMRDIPSDRAAGIKTPASLLGPKGALALYWLCHLIPYAVCSMLIARYGRMMLLPFLALPLTRRTLAAATRTWIEAPDSPPWRRLERASGAIHLIFGILYAIALGITKDSL